MLITLTHTQAKREKDTQTRRHRDYQIKMWFSVSGVPYANNRMKLGGYADLHCEKQYRPNKKFRKKSKLSVMPKHKMR